MIVLNCLLTNYLRCTWKRAVELRKCFHAFFRNLVWAETWKLSLKTGVPFDCYLICYVELWLQALHHFGTESLYLSINKYWRTSRSYPMIHKVNLIPKPVLQKNQIQRGTRFCEMNLWIMYNPLWVNQIHDCPTIRLNNAKIILNTMNVTYPSWPL